MKRKWKNLAGLFFLMLCLLTGCAGSTAQDNSSGSQEQSRTASKAQEQSSDNTAESDGLNADISESGTYSAKDEVAAYIHEYGHLPQNFITKKEAKSLGWVSKKGNLKEVAPGKSIGGDYFGNYEGSLPKKDGRKYYECDIDADGGYRGAKRIIYSNDGQIYYTEDHYETFELLYGEG